MKKKISNEIQHIRSKCKKRATSQRIYSFINKDALFLESNSFQDFMIGLEIDVTFPKEVMGNLLHNFLERNLLIAAVMKRVKTQIMGCEYSKMCHFPPLKQLGRHTKVLNRKNSAFKSL